MINGYFFLTNKLLINNANKNKIENNVYSIFDPAMVFCTLIVGNEKALLLYNLLNEKDKTFSFERELIISELENKLIM